MNVPDFTAKMTSFNDMTWSSMIDGEPTKNNGININYLGTLSDILRYLFSFLYSSYYSSVLCFISYLFNFSKDFSSSSSYFVCLWVWLGLGNSWETELQEQPLWITDNWKREFDKGLFLLLVFLMFFPFLFILLFFFVLFNFFYPVLCQQSRKHPQAFEFPSYYHDLWWREGKIWNSP